MKRLIEYFVDRSFTVNLICVAVLLIGIGTAWNMKRDLIPAFKWNHISINVNLPGASPTDVERMVTFPIEESVRNLPELEEIYSESFNGGCWVYLKFKAGHDDMPHSLEQVRGLVESLEATILPQNIRRIRIKQSRVDSVDFLFLNIQNIDQMNPIHRAWARSISEEIRKIDGIVKTSIYLRNRKIYIELSPRKLSRAGITVSQVRRKVLEHITYMPIGSLDINDKNISIELSQSFRGIRALKNLPILANRSGHSLRLKDLATVEMRLPERDRLYLTDGNRNNVGVDLYKDIDSDAITLRNKVQAIIDTYNKEKFPKPIVASLAGDGAAFIEKQLNVMKKNGLVGLGLVLLTLMFFLGWRTSLVTAAGLPLAYLGTLMAFKAFGIAIDLISVIGLIVVIGILVDDAIIVSERFVENLEKGFERRKAAVEAAYSLIAPVTGTVLTTIVAFSPILLIKSDLSMILFSIPIVIIAALTLSWLESFFILPNHLYHFVHNKRSIGHKYFEPAKKLYEKNLRFCLKWRYPALIALFAFSGLTGYIAAKHIKGNYRFHIGAERIVINVVLKESASLEATADKLDPLHAYLNTIPKEDVAMVSTKIGQMWHDGKERTGKRYAQLRLYFPNLSASPTKIRERLEKEIGEKLKSFKTDDFQVLEVKSKKDGSEDKKESMISVQALGDDKLSIADLRDEIREVTKGITEIEMAELDENLLQASWKFQINERALIRYGLSRSGLANQLGEYFDYKEVGYVRIDGEQVRVDTRIGTQPEAPQAFSELSTLIIVTPRGLDVPLRLLGKWTRSEELKSISHKKAKRLVNVDFKYDDDKHKIEDLQKKIETAVAPLREKYPAYTFSVQNADEEAARNKSWALKAALLCFGLILLVLALVLGSITQPLLVGLAIPFGMIGIIWALFLHGMDLGIMAIIGLLGTAGVAVNDSLIMVDSINRLDDGKKRQSFTKRKNYYRRYKSFKGDHSNNGHNARRRLSHGLWPWG